MRALVLAAALAVSACAFSSEAGFFTARDSAFPIADGALVEMRESTGDDTPDRVIFRRAAGGYELSPIAPEEPPEKTMQVLFIAVPETPEDDYILQVRIDPDEPSVAYAFAWRTLEGFRLISDPDEFDEIPDALAFLDAHCRRMSYGECQFAARADVLAFHRDFVAPLYVRGARAPEDAIDLVLIMDADAPRSATPRPIPRKG